MKRVRSTSTVDPEHLTTAELLAVHERIFGPLALEAKRRMLRAGLPQPQTRSSDSTYVLAA
jgi:hypothetical protein